MCDHLTKDKSEVSFLEVEWVIAGNLQGRTILARDTRLTLLTPEHHPDRLKVAIFT